MELRHFLKIMTSGVVLLLAGCKKNKPTSQPTIITEPAPTVIPTEVPVGAPGDKVLLIGINKYKGAGPLRGCVNDVNDMKAFLITHYGFKPDQFLIILDEDATAAGILTGLAWLVAGAVAGDRRYFHYSGHGAQDAVAELGTEPDRINELMCPHDFDWTPARMIIDKQLVNVFSKFPLGVIFGWSSDSCNSGDLSRAILPPNIKSAQARTFPNIPPAVTARIAKVKTKNTVRGFINGKLEVGFLSGCQSDQTSADLTGSDGRSYGAFTNALITVLPTMKNASLNDVGKALRNHIAAQQLDQRPQAEGSRADRPFLK